MGNVIQLPANASRAKALAVSEADLQDQLMRLKVCLEAVAVNLNNLRSEYRVLVPG